MSKKLTVLHYNSNSGNKPSASDLSYGEIAIGYKTDNEAIFIKNDNDDVIAFKPNANSTIVNVTYNDLKTLRDNKKLNPSSWYRITDFVTTVANDDEARSANHPFDIIVFASDNNVLQEEAFAALHEGDTYFKDCDLNAWKIWYCIDNDTTRFQWADTTNGKGVIYRMIDEWQNDCPYDFKNVQYKRYKVIDNSPNGELSALDGTYIGYNGQMQDLFIDDYGDYMWCYTFTLIDENDEWVDYSSKPNRFDDDVSYFAQIKKGRCEYNLIRHLYGAVSFEDAYYQVQSLNNIVLISTMVDSGLSGEMLLNTFGVGNYNMTLKENPEQNHFGDKCYNNIVGSYGNIFGNNCIGNIFGRNCVGNTFGDGCIGNIFERNCWHNTFGNECNYNIFGNSCWHNTFGNDCNENTFGNDCKYNIFGNDCYGNTFRKSFLYNTIGNNVHNINVLGEKVYYTNILNGTSGDSKKLLVINFETGNFEAGKGYSQFAGFDSNGELQIWVDADLSENNNGDGDGDDNIIITTYANLKSMRDDSELILGKRYRITDFVTTVANDDEARSANHPFDIIVLATDTNVLQEEAFAAMPSNGDTYFNDCNLNAWKIWYCIDNDNTRFQWADSVNGKGVIYRMIDEFGNDCPYDFKNVQFKRYKVTDESNGILSSLNNTYCGYNGEMQGLSIQEEDSVWAYTFSIGDRKSTPIDASILGYNNEEIGEGYGCKGYYGDNIIKPTTSIATNDGETNSVFCLNNIVWWTNNPMSRSLINGNRIESECFNMTLSGNGTLIGHDCRCFIMDDRCFGNTFGNGCYENTFGNYCTFNTLGNRCFCNIFGDRCHENTFGDSCHGNTFEYGNMTNIVGNSCNNIKFGNSCDNNTFESNCDRLTFGNNCVRNTFGDSCGSNTFGSNCEFNTFGNSCFGNTFGDSCQGNTFRNRCWHNTFGNNFQSNTLGESVQHVKVTTDNVQFTQILNGTQGSDASKLTINFLANTEYSQKAGFDTTKTLRIWSEANLADGVIECGIF